MRSLLTYTSWNETREKEINENLRDFMDTLKWAFQQYQESILYACSLGAEGMVLLDLINKVNPEAKVVFLDTNLHFPETYSLLEKVKERYPYFNFIIRKPSLTLEQQAHEFGDRLWERDPNQCCLIRKITPLEDELSNVEAWLTGLRREQSKHRSRINYVNKDDRFKRVKICPLIHWTWDDIWNYIELNNLPYNELHDQHYPSIGCEMCTLPVEPGDNARSGRWANFEKNECGLHLN